MKPARHPVLQKPRRCPTHRRGFTTPAVAIALLVVMGGLALVLDRLWLDATDLELTAAAEAAALAGAGELASDDLLKPNPDSDARAELARNSAAFIAGQNYVAGSPVVLSTDPQGDIRIGRLTVDDQSQKVQFVESNSNPTTVVVTAMRTRRTNNPVGLFVAGVTGQPFGDVVTRVEAGVDNRVVGVRPVDGTPVPALPLAIWWKDPSGQRADTWQAQIEARQGQDQYGFDPIGHQVYSGSDGIPEIHLHSQPSGQQSSNSNMLVVDIGTSMNDQSLQRQFQSGWSVEDLAPFGGQFCINDASPTTVNASAELLHADRESLDGLIGQARICLLYSTAVASDSQGLMSAVCIRLVAIRILAVNDQTDGSCDIIAQPCVIRTRTALLDVSMPYSTDGVLPVSPYLAPAANTPTNASDPATGNAAASTSATTLSNTPAATPGNPYIYKLQLTH